MKIRDNREDEMLDRIACRRVWLFGIGKGTDPRWLQIRAEREADRLQGILNGEPGFLGIKVVWPHNLAVFDSPLAAVEARRKLEDLGIACGDDIMRGAALPELKEISVKGKWEEKE